MLYLGCDPGASGGLALIDEGGSVHELSKTPATRQDHLDFVRVCRAIGEASGTEVRAVVEKVGVRPGEGAVGAFTFGRTVERLEFALEASGVPYELVTPQTWQRGLGIPKKAKSESKTAYKNRLKASAQALFPSQSVTLWSADALLLAEYLRRLHRNPATADA